MNNFNVELHTKSELSVGERLIAEIKQIQNIANSINDETETRVVCVVNPNGRRARVLGYINNMPQYTNMQANQLIEAMDSNNVEKVQVTVVKKEKQQIDDRSIYLLAVDNEDVTSSLVASSIPIASIVKSVTEELGLNISNEVDNGDSAAVVLSNEDLIERAISEITNSSLENNDVNQDKPFTLVSVKYKVGGLTKDNPNKSLVTTLVKNGEQPDLELVRDENNNLRVKFNGGYAGEITENQPVVNSLNVKDVHSIEVTEAKTLSYIIDVKLKEYKNDVSSNVQENSGDESLFVEIMKPILTEIMDTNSEVALTAEDLKSNESLINDVWNIVNRLKGKEVEINNSYTPVNTVSTEQPLKNEVNSVEEKKAKKADADEVEEIVLYLTSNGISEKYVNKIVKSYIAYPERYLERIPSSKDKGFTPWKYDGRGENLLKLAIIAIEMGKNLRFVGGKGAGKNTLLSTLSWVYQRPLFSQSANRDTDITHLFGDKTIDAVSIEGQIAQTVEFEKGLLVEAMEVGGFYEFGEGNACRPEVTMALHSILDSRREADVNGYKLVKANKNFAFVLTMNVDYEGCNSLNQAFRDRFVTVAFPSPATIVKVLKQACPTAKNRDIEICDKLYTHILSRVDELQTDEIVTIRGYINALDLAEDLSLKTALKMCVAHNVSDDELIVQEILEIIDSVVA